MSDIGHSSEADYKEMAASIDYTDNHLSVTANENVNKMQMSDIDASGIESMVSSMFSPKVKADESSENTNVKPIIHVLPDDEEICESVELGENIKGDIYSNGLLHIYGYGDMKDFSNSPFVNAAGVTQILLQQSQ